MASCSTSSCFIFSFSLSLLLLFSSATIDTISANRSVSGSQNITSKDGNFRLGFFVPPDSPSLSYYVGIWYNQIPLLTPVWVANRDSPVTDPAMSELRISGDGNLVLLSNAGVIWSSNSTASNSTAVAVLFDTGNLQLRDESNSSLVFWQSFDHPTDTWLPGSKLGFNKITGRSQHLTSWKSKVDPSPGIFTLEIDPTGATSEYFIFWNLSKMYWRSGIWDGNIFNLVPEMTSNYIYAFNFINDTEEMYFNYTVKFSNITSRFVLDSESGQIQQTSWMENTKSWMLFWSQPKTRCSVYGVCGSFGSCNDVATPFCNCLKGFRIKSQPQSDLGDKSEGCQRKTPLQCSGLNNNSANSEKDGFFEMTNVRLPDSPNTLATAASREGCELACLSNCSCSAYSYNGSGCFVWHEVLLNLQEQYSQADAGTLYLRLAASELQSSERNKKRAVSLVIIGVFVLAILFASVPAILIVIKKRERRRMIEKANATQNGLVSFTYNELQQATRKFSTKLGGGGFGSVFKGSLPGSNDISVKKLEGLRQGEKQFRTEVSTVGRIQHVNLVRLLGFCSQGSKRLLVYEFMPNGSLDSHLFHSAPSSHLSWRTRYQIAIGIARGIAYLHEQCRECIIHCDIKPENILLDASFNPKVADFGLAKLMGRDFSRVLTTLRGTKGYLAPEWITGVAITAKADVYSYGMVLLEIISGRRNLEQPTAEEDGTRYFPTFAASKLIEGDAAGMLDSKLGPEEVNVEELDRACKIACWCIQDDESCRPTMGQVVQVLEGIIDVLPPPVPRSLLLAPDVPQPINFFFECSSKNPSTQAGKTTSNCSETKSHTSSSSDNK